MLSSVTLKFEPKPPLGRAPSSRGYHAAILADSGTRIWLFGGFDGTNVFDDVWILDLASQAYLAQVTIFDVDGMDGNALNDEEYDGPWDGDDGWHEQQLQLEAETGYMVG